MVHGLRSALLRRPGRAVALAAALTTALATAVVLASVRPAAEPAPVLPAAVSSFAPAAVSAPVSTAAAAVGPIVVSVVGRVANPGIVRLPAGARVADAIDAAGGAQPGADTTTVNLARKLADGEQVYVGIPIPPGMAAASGPGGADSCGGAAGAGSGDGVAGSGLAGSGLADSGGAAAPGGPGADQTPTGKKGGKSKKAGLSGQQGAKVNLNNASAGELEQLPGVGPATAQKILDWRAQHQRFGSVTQLREIGGIGQAKFDKLKDLVTI